MGATQVAHNSVFYAHTKHIELSYYFIRELVSTSFLQVLFVRSNNLFADLFTKGYDYLLPHFIPFMTSCSGILLITLRGHDRIQDIDRFV
jgi:hypothetical protein